MKKAWGFRYLCFKINGLGMLACSTNRLGEQVGCWQHWRRTTESWVQAPNYTKLRLTVLQEQRSGKRQEEGIRKFLTFSRRADTVLQLSHKSQDLFPTRQKEAKEVNKPLSSCLWEACWCFLFPAITDFMCLLRLGTEQLKRLFVPSTYFFCPG